MTDGEDARPTIVGLTGNIGTGKSTVAAMLLGFGADVIDADKVAHEVMRPGTPVHTQIVDVFGPSVLTPDGEIDRKRLGAIVFSDSKALARLEAIVHPATLEAIDRRIASTSADVVIIEAIKLIESSLARKCDTIWVTTCRPEQQIERIMSARGLTRAQARQRVEAQPPQVEKAALADVVVDNAGSLSATREQVEAAWRRMVEGASKSSGENARSAPERA
jgi:dephospho-CoA kinase